jgi:hypothetical protein
MELFKILPESTKKGTGDPNLRIFLPRNSKTRVGEAKCREIPRLAYKLL